MTSLSSWGADPVTWSYVKLYGVHLEKQLQSLDGLPGSHSWTQTRSGHPHLLTKAQLMGVLVSIQERKDRVEFLVDDGTGCVPAVLWTATWSRHVTLGDLVHVEGKLNLNVSIDLPRPTRELRVARIAKVEDPNEEVLFWLQVMHLSSTVYSLDGVQPTAVATTAPPTSGESGPWQGLLSQLFFDLDLSENACRSFLSESNEDNVYDERRVGLQTLRILVERQQTTNKCVTCTFQDILSALPLGDASSRSALVRPLRRTFQILRQSGVFWLEDTMSDRHRFQSFATSLQPVMTTFIRQQQRVRMPELAEHIYSHAEFKLLPLDWLNAAVIRLVQSGLISQGSDSQLTLLDST
ncbi:TPA: hypothetical protein N0F65_007376 [Lagenidium giganteum]|uniref:CST complex subunit STN1 n=1 Tax=Lagenidium giganteum TaxID=4803 RepID=A0AAV2YI78_9STRA|nr:TPA: hypothetical protein N0F65_007376 [Lagenidium giganteum]